MTKEMPFIDRKPVFREVADLATLAKMSNDEFQLYMDSVDAYRTNIAAMSYQRAEGRAEGELSTNIKHIKRLSSRGLSNETIAETLDLPLQFIIDTLS